MFALPQFFHYIIFELGVCNNELKMHRIPAVCPLSVPAAPHDHIHVIVLS